MTVELVRSYATVADVKSYLSISSSAISDDDIAAALNTASRLVDTITGRTFTPADPTATTTRTYRPRAGTSSLDVAAVVADELLAIRCDTTGDGTYDYLLTLDDEYTVDYQAGEVHPVLGEPWPAQRIHLTDGRRWHLPKGRPTVQITGRHGWPETPAIVRQAALIFAARYQRRALSPEGILTSFDTAIRVGYMLDPDATNALKPYIRNPVKV